MLLPKFCANFGALDEPPPYPPLLFSMPGTALGRGYPEAKRWTAR